jgi:uncharacterized membrane protein YfcA
MFVGIYIGEQMLAELDELAFRRLVNLTLVAIGFALVLPK